MYAEPYDLSTIGSKKIKWELEGNKAGVERHGWHAFRRGFATCLHEAGVQDKVIQSLMRHSSPSVTMKHYTKVSNATNIAAIHRLQPIEPKKGKK
jgi:integrase